jgi:ferritin-like metal-binding protein YciE
LPWAFDFSRQRLDVRFQLFGALAQALFDTGVKSFPPSRRKPIRHSRGGDAARKNCAAITGIIDEGEEVIEDYEGSPALDAVEHYEIARYGTLKAWARELKLNDAVTLLQTTLEEEENTDIQLSDLAENLINQKAEAAE